MFESSAVSFPVRVSNLSQRHALLPRSRAAVRSHIEAELSALLSSGPLCSSTPAAKMKPTSVLLILTSCVLALTWAADNMKAKPLATRIPALPSFPTPTAAPNTTTTTTAAPNTTTTTTAAPNTTTTTTAAPNTTTTTTAAPNTTTTTPKTTTTTTPKTTTTIAPNTTTTTIAPNTTTTSTTTTMGPTTTTQAPPHTNNTVGNYTLMKDKQLCLMAQMELKIRLVTDKDQKTFSILPNKTSTAGECNDPTANLTLVFPEGFVTFLFKKNASQESTFVNEVSFQIKTNFAKANEVYSAKNESVHLFNSKIGHSYSCKQESLYMGNNLYLDVDKDRLQAFNFTKSEEFGTSDPCPADRNNYRVAIAVGVTLLVLIVVVVVAYLLARKKRADGYQSL